MRDRRWVVVIALICLMSGWMLCELGSKSGLAQAQQPSGASDSTQATIHVEAREVLVDTVVTDKKGNYVRDLTQKDFKVWEDGKEQTLNSFSFEENTGEPSKSRPRYMVLLFDNSTMNMADQAQARIAAGRFIDANAGPDRLIAIADFGGAVHISQDFTADAALLKQVVANLQGTNVSPNAQPTLASVGTSFVGPSLGNAEAEFGIHSVLLALRTLAKSLSTVPGRKTLVMLTSGFVMTPEFQSELTAVIDTCNKSNVAVYPIDVRGLVVPDVASPHSHRTEPSLPLEAGRLSPAAFHYSTTSDNQRPMLRLAAFAEPAEALDPQHGGGGGGGGGGGHGGGSGGGGGGGHGGGSGGGGSPGGGGGGRTGGGGTPPGATNTGMYNPYTQPRQIVPPFPSSASDNQQVLYQLADGTGGFVIVNTNDLLGGLERIAKDQNQYYLLGYVPAVSPEGSCHTLKVKVERSGTAVRARSGYCNARPADLLAGNSIEKDLENRAVGEMKGNVTASMEAPFFYTSANTAQIHLALDVPGNALKFEKVKGKEHATLNVLGIAYKGESSIAARFSDTVSVDLDGKKEVEAFQKQPYHYENQFGITSGQYKLRVVFSSGNDTFGKLEMPLSIDPYGAQEFSLSGVALSNNMRPAASISADLDGQLLEDMTPLLVQGVYVSPSASNHFKKTDTAGLYAEIYEPLMKDPNPPGVAFEMKVVDRKTGQEKLKIRERPTQGKPGNPVIPLGLKLPVATLDPGSYRVTLQAGDALGHISKVRTVDFEVD